MVDTSNILIKKLIGLGFEQKEALVYIAIVELGQSTASRIARHTRLKRTTVYNLIPSLLDKGYIEKSLIKNISYFSVHTIKSISAGIEEKLKEAQSIEQELESIKSVRPTKSKVSVFEGIEGLKNVYTDVIRNTQKGSIIYAFFHSANQSKLPPKEIFEIEAYERVRRGLHLKLISDNKTEFQKDWETDPKQLREVKFVQSKTNVPINGETIITPDKIMHISYLDGFLCTVIENPDIVRMQRLMFEQLWERI